MHTDSGDPWPFMSGSFAQAYPLVHCKRQASRAPDIYSLQSTRCFYFNILSLPLTNAKRETAVPAKRLRYSTERRSLKDKTRVKQIGQSVNGFTKHNEKFSESQALNSHFNSWYNGVLTLLSFFSLFPFVIINQMYF